MEICSLKDSLKGVRKPKTFVPDDDFQLFRIHGWILLEALKYTNKASCGLDEAQKKVWNDVFLNLKSDKSDIPSELHHLDRGGMTFPKSSFMPFMIKADLHYKEHTCEENFQRYGQKVGEVTKTQLLYNVELEGEFFRCIHPEETASNIKVTQRIYRDKCMNSGYKSTLIPGLKTPFCCSK